jgi:hypothetical protein
MLPSTRPASPATPSSLSPLVRRLVLALALALGLAAGLPRSLPVVHAAVLIAQASPTATLPAVPAPPAAPVPPAPPAPQAGASDPAATADEDEPQGEAAPQRGRRAEVTIDRHGIVIDKGDHQVRIAGDEEYDSFDQFVEKAPWLAGLVFLCVVLFFLVPLLIVILVIWYKMRKARAQNEVMLKLAEKGVVSTPEAMSAIVAPVPPIPPPPGPTPLYEHARQLRRQAAWSDLRKGVVLVAIGLAFIFYSMINEGSASWPGLICLFLGVGYTVLWFFEDRNAPARRDAGPPPAGGA